MVKLYGYDMMKCRRNVNFQEMYTEHSTGKNDGFWLLWGIFKEYIKQNIIMAVLRKTLSHSVVICRLTKKIDNVKEDQRRKTDSNFDFSLAAQCLWGFNKKECYILHLHPKQSEIGT